MSAVQGPAGLRLDAELADIVTEDALVAALYYKALMEQNVPWAVAMNITQSYVTSREMADQHVTVHEEDPPEPWQQ